MKKLAQKVVKILKKKKLKYLLHKTLKQVIEKKAERYLIEFVILQRQKKILNICQKLI